MSPADSERQAYIPYDPATFPDEINHPSGQTLVIDRSRLVVFNLDAVTALSLGQAASQTQRSIVESMLQQPREMAVRKAASIGRELGIRIEDGADQPNVLRINHTPWQLWFSSEAGEAITQQWLTEIGKQFRAALGWPRLLVGAVYRVRQTTGTTSLLSPLPHVLGIRLRASVADQSADIAGRLSSRHGLLESNISRFLPRQYRCFTLKDFVTRPVYRLPTTIMDQEKDYIEEIFFDYMPLFVPTGSFVPNDKYYQKPTSRSSPYQWNLYKIKTEDGWNLRTPPVLGAGVTVAVIDDGCEINSHPDLPANAFVANKGVTITYTTLQYIGGAALQNESHGTQCAGIIGARCNNNTEGIAGIAGQCQIMPIRVEAYNDLSISAAIGYASSNGARIISMSFGGEPASPLAYSTQDVRHAVTEAFAQKNVVLCAATMNNGGENFIPYPAAYPEVIACGASDPNDKRWALSNYGEDTTSGGIVSVVAPGMDIPTTANIGQGDSGDPNYTGEWSGTSAATPHVAALAALMISANPNLTSQEVKDYIEQTADKVPDISYYLQTKPNGPWGPEHGYGRVNVYKALQKALGGASSPAAPTGLRVN